MILWLIVNATKDSGNSWPFECPFTLKVRSHTRPSWAWFSTRPLKLKSGRFQTIYNVRFDLHSGVLVDSRRLTLPKVRSTSIMRSCGVAELWSCWVAESALQLALCGVTEFLLYSPSSLVSQGSSTRGLSWSAKASRILRLWWRCRPFQDSC